MDPTQEVYHTRATSTAAAFADTAELLLEQARALLARGDAPAAARLAYWAGLALDHVRAALAEAAP